jgi:hypothetical protein
MTVIVQLDTLVKLRLARKHYTVLHTNSDPVSKGGLLEACHEVLGLVFCHCELTFLRSVLN